MIASYVASAKSSWFDTTKAFVSFLRSPRLNGPGPITARLKMVTIVWLFVLSALVTAAFALAALPFLLTSEPTVAGGLSNVTDQPVVTMIVTIVILGPLIEEMIFRGWLIGTWQALIGTTAFVATFYVATPFAQEFVGAPLVVVQLGIMALALTVFYAIALIQPRPTIRYFDRVFPIVFWAQGVLFGALHFGNLYAQSIAIPLLMTLPLIVCGWLWGYARVVLGLPAALVLHMAYNVPSAVGMAVLIATRA
jgi:membrane protease YdiL (CAAX protease family)